MEEQNREIPSHHPQHLFSNGSSNYRDDEISLLDLWQILVRHKSYIFVCFIICVVAGVLYIVLKPPVFQASTQLRIGETVDIGFLEDSGVISATLLFRYGKDLADGIKRELPVLKKASVSEASRQVIELTVEGSTPEESTTLLKQITVGVIRKHDTIQQSNLTALKRRIQKLESLRNLLQKELDIASELYQSLKNKDPVQASIFLLEYFRITTSLFLADQESFLLEQKLISPKTTPPEILGEIVAPVEPAAPKKILVVALSSVFGLMAGLMIAFVAEFISNARSG